MDNDYHEKLEENKVSAAQRTAKKRQKRLKRKEKLKGKKKKTVDQSSQNSESESSSSSSEEEQQKTQSKNLEELSTKITDEAQRLETQEVNNPIDHIDQSQKDLANTNTEVQADKPDTTAADVETE